MRGGGAPQAPENDHDQLHFGKTAGHTRACQFLSAYP